jgi:hypothetical protein
MRLILLDKQTCAMLDAWRKAHLPSSSPASRCFRRWRLKQRSGLAPAPVASCVGSRSVLNCVLSFTNRRPPVAGVAGDLDADVRVTAAPVPGGRVVGSGPRQFG